MLKDLLIDFALWMAKRRNGQAERYHASSEWWTDLSQALEEGIPLRVVRSRRGAAGKAEQ